MYEGVFLPDEIPELSRCGRCNNLYKKEKLEELQQRVSKRFSEKVY